MRINADTIITFAITVAVSLLAVYNKDYRWYIVVFSVMVIIIAAVIFLNHREKRWKNNKKKWRDNDKRIDQYNIELSDLRNEVKMLRELFSLTERVIKLESQNANRRGKR